MSFHDIHHHGRVVHGEAARDIMALRKRDSHGDQVKMHVPVGFPLPAGDASSNSEALAVAQKDVSVVFVTLPQTFAGPASFVTLTGPVSFPSLSLSNPFAPAATTSAQAPTIAQASATPASSVEPASSQPTEPATSEVVASQLATSDIPTSLLTATAPATVMVGVPIATTRASTSSSLGSPSSTSSSSLSASATDGLSGASSQQGISQSGGGLSGGASAGLAIGIILAIGAVAGLLFFCWRRRKNPQAAEDLNEKHRSFADASARSIEAAGKQGAAAMGGNVTTTAPRLSLRPVTTQFLPTLGGEQNARIPNALGIGLAAAHSEKSKSSWERLSRNNSDTSQRSNPFDDATPFSEKEARPASPPSDNNPFDETPSTKSHSSQKLALDTAGPAVDIAAAVAAAGVTGSTVKAAVNSAPAPVVATGPGPQGSNNVHRVQLDFKPSMDDELELKSGQLVRMLHEYDDGWALCIRMDRSQQGVAPRTCLSKLPVKPRQGPPPQNQGPRPSPQNAPRPSPPATSRNAPGPQYIAQAPAQVSNAPRPANGPMYPRPLANSPRDRAQSITQNNLPPAVARVPVRKPTTPEAPQSVPASAAVSEPDHAAKASEVTSTSPPAPMQSPIERAASTSPTSGAVLSRKPVPGQAM